MNGTVAGGGAWFNNAKIYSMTNPLGGVEVAVDVTSRKVWARNSGGSWLGGGDPATGATPTCTLSGTGDIYAVASNIQWHGDSITIHTDPENVTGSAPSGFSSGLPS